MNQALATSASVDPARVIGAWSTRVLQLGSEMDQVLFQRDFGALWDEVGNLRRTRLKWYRFYQLGLFARIVVANGVRGDYAEFGTWRGGSLYLVASEWSRAGEQRRLLGFDSFEGLPTPNPRLDSKELVKGMFNDNSHDEVRAFFDQKGMSNVHLVKGWFSDTIHELAATDLALSHIDADCYDSCKLALEHCYERTVPGGYIVMDDYRNPKCAGATIAAEEFFARRKEVIRMAPGIDCSAWVQKA